MSGPSLVGFWGHKAGTQPGFHRYSDALKRSQIVWNESMLDKCLSNPEATVPGNLMLVEGLREEKARADLIAFLQVASEGKGPREMKREGLVRIHGLNYKDRPEDAEKWLDELGDPYTRTGADRDGRVAIDWGVYGVSETFVIDRDGRIVYKHIWPVTPKLIEDTLRPLIGRLRQ